MAHNHAKSISRPNTERYRSTASARGMRPIDSRVRACHRERDLLERAIALDPDYAHAHAWKACTLGQSYVYGWCDDREATAEQVMEELRIALGLDDNDGDVHRVLAAVNLAAHHDYEKTFYHQERALDLNPNDDLVVVQHGKILTGLGAPGRGD